jgi:hypothetical protein
MRGSAGTAALPHGFTQGQKSGWHGASTPPGWSDGEKTGWGGQHMPPGLKNH